MQRMCQIRLISRLFDGHDPLAAPAEKSAYPDRRTPEPKRVSSGRRAGRWEFGGGCSKIERRLQ
jgi:hypothetical protein